jgi:hypothetical protein
MNRHLEVGCLILSAFVVSWYSSAAASESTCAEGEQITRKAMTLMAATARDESTKLRGLVRNGWQTPYDDLTIIRSFQLDGCRMQANVAQVTVTFDVVGRLVAAGHGSRVSFERVPHKERRVFKASSVDGTTKVEDIGALEPHVNADYAITILNEIAHGEPQFEPKTRALIEEIQAAVR